MNMTGNVTREDTVTAGLESTVRLNGVIGLYHGINLLLLLHITSEFIVIE